MSAIRRFRPIVPAFGRFAPLHDGGRRLWYVLPMRRPFLVVVVLCLLAGGRAAAMQIATTSADYVQPGTQPDAATFDDFEDSVTCAQCHGGFLASGDAPADTWVTSMMAQAARDP